MQFRQFEFNQALKDYLTMEGPALRGPRFEKLVLFLSDQRLRGMTLSESLFLNYAGPPDVTKDIGNVRGLAFNYAGEDGRNYSIVLTVRDGRVVEIGFRGDPVKPREPTP